ncbi:riboflavin kinase [Microbotryomycetes sp. JL221]|nr:riboflavin kinase [Microbotryomycetes sp. JL221]
MTAAAASTSTAASSSSSASAAAASSNGHDKQHSGAPLTTRPTTPLQHDPTRSRPMYAGASSGPTPPFPVYLEGWVTRGFGRGSKDLGCPTANLPDSSIVPYATTLSTGVYFGFARVSDPNETQNESAFPTMTGQHDDVYPMVMSIGFNPYYKNEKRTAEVHILHEYPSDFYGKELRVVMLGFIRPEYNYASLDALIDDINTDKQVAERSVNRQGYKQFERDEFFTRSSRLQPLPPDQDPTKPRPKPQDHTA